MPTDLVPNPEGTYPSNPESPFPAWIRCEACEDFLCTLHPGQHAYDCDCPAIEEWGCDPYSAGGVDPNAFDPDVSTACG